MTATMPMHDDLLLQRPQAITPVSRLVLLFHGVGARAEDLRTGAAATTLLGFSQGAIMALESTQQPEPLATRVIAIAGRFAQPPRVAPAQLALHLLHGEQDRVMAPSLASEAAAQWRALGGRATLDLLPGLAHGIDARVAQRVAGYLGSAAT